MLFHLHHHNCDDFILHTVDKTFFPVEAEYGAMFVSGADVEVDGYLAVTKLYFQFSQQVS